MGQLTDSGLLKGPNISSHGASDFFPSPLTPGFKLCKGHPRISTKRIHEVPSTNPRTHVRENQEEKVGTDKFVGIHSFQPAQKGGTRNRDENVKLINEISTKREQESRPSLHVQDRKISTASAISSGKQAHERESGKRKQEIGEFLVSSKPCCPFKSC